MSHLSFGYQVLKLSNDISVCVDGYFSWRGMIAPMAQKGFWISDFYDLYPLNFRVSSKRYSYEILGFGKLLNAAIQWHRAWH